MDAQKIYNKFDRYYNSHKYINETSWHVFKYIRVKKALELKSKKNILIPIEKFSYKIIQSHKFSENIETIIDGKLYLNKLYLNELKGYLTKYFTFYKFSSDQVIYSFILTVDNLLKNFNLKKVFLLIMPLVDTMESIEFSFYNVKQHFTELAAFMVEDYYHDKEINFKDKFYYISFLMIIFSPYCLQHDFKRILKVFGNDSYKKFLNEICLYVKNEELSEKDKELFKQFVIHYRSNFVNEYDKLGECLINFARKGFICEDVPKKLDNKYVDEYTSLILMEELKNEHTRNL